ncbi:MAG: hypothetical protein D6805_03110 [Planctomycetota bacterium]|nr:MAG: hypothetical protein D6805_03110 [Planctomycetota bacterium]
MSPLPSQVENKTENSGLFVFFVLFGSGLILLALSLWGIYHFFFPIGQKKTNFSQKLAHRKRTLDQRAKNSPNLHSTTKPSLLKETSHSPSAEKKSSIQRPERKNPPKSSLQTAQNKNHSPLPHQKNEKKRSKLHKYYLRRATDLQKKKNYLVAASAYRLAAYTALNGNRKKYLMTRYQLYNYLSRLHNSLRQKQWAHVEIFIRKLLSLPLTYSERLLVQEELLHCRKTWLHYIRTQPHNRHSPLYHKMKRIFLNISPIKKQSS